MNGVWHASSGESKPCPAIQKKATKRSFGACGALTFRLFAAAMGSMRRWLIVCSLACTTATAHASEPAPSTVPRAAVKKTTLEPTTVEQAESENESTPAKEPEPRVPHAVAAIGSVVPGLVIHGTGSWLHGDSETASRLLVAEGVGIGLTVASLGALALTGAARDWAGLFISTAIMGAGTFGLSFLADVYRSTVPEGFGKNPGGLPWGGTEVGVLWVNSPRIDYGPIVQSRGILRTGQWSSSVTLSHAPYALHQNVRIENGFQLWGAPPERSEFQFGGSHVSVFISVENWTYGRPDYSTNAAEARVAMRFDSEHLLPSVKGAFFEWEAGYAGRRTKFRNTGNTLDDSLLLGGFGFGAYHGDPTTRGGETRLYYNHRHDGYTGGLLQPGLGSGTIGYFGLETTHFFNPTWGLRLRGEIGAAAVLGLHLVGRAWSQNGALGFLSFD